MVNLQRFVFLNLLICIFFISDIYAQDFIRITDSSNPIITGSSPNSYLGASWVDFDDDGDLDLFVNNTSLYQNNGNGVFISLSTNIGSGLTNVSGNGGNSWADYDNDGDLDVFVSGSSSFLYRNEGSGSFARITGGSIGGGTANRGWACAWGDYNNDGNVDLVITHPAGFVGASIPNHLFLNDGPPDYTFTKIISGVVVTGLAAYTVASWSDYDNDGDMDLFIGSGPASSTAARDNLYRNMLSETGTANFERISDSPIATDLLDGQLWNWIDYDNDGDLDAYLTNWGGSGSVKRNNLYRNDGSGFVRINSGNIATDQFVSLSSVWGDFDNDDDLDCFVANDHSQPNRYYKNNGDGTFTTITTGVFAANIASNRGASAGDYDNDGDLDLFVLGSGASGRFLYRNDLNDNNSWINIKAIGKASNRSAIGAKVRVKATISGNPVWQMREISGQNTFNGHNSLRVHFGFGDAVVIDSLKVEWPSGIVDVFTDVDVDQFMVIEEGMTTDISDRSQNLPDGFELNQNYPNPFNPMTSIKYSIPKTSHVVIKIYNILGKEMTTLVNETQTTGVKSVIWDGRDDSGQIVTSGIYIYKMQAGNLVQSKKMLFLK